MRVPQLQLQLPGRSWRHRSAFARTVWPIVALCWLLAFAGASFAAEIIFRPPPVPARAHDWKSVLATSDLPGADQENLAKLLTAAEQHPSVGTGVSLFAHMSLLTPSVRERVNAANRYLLPMADLARHELTIQTNIALNGGPDGDRVAAVSRAGSSAKRHRQWLEWDGDWDYLPFDAEYFKQEVGSSDDDLTLWASEAAIAQDPAAHERINGQFAKDQCNALARQYRDAALAGLPDDLKAALRAVDFTDGSGRMKIGFLSPTRAWRVMPAVMQQDLRAAPHDLAAVVLADPDKYFGLFFEEQIHRWGSDKGIVTETVGNPKLRTVSYAESLANGKLKILSGDTPDDWRALDPFGWAANSYRQSFGTHHGKLKDVAKYTWRIVLYWEHAGLELKKAIADTADAEGYNAPVDDVAMMKLVKTIYKPDSVEALDAAIAAEGGQEAVGARLKNFQTRLLIASHRRHVQVIAKALVAIAKAKKLPVDAELSFDDLKRLAGDDPSYFNFDRSLDALANAYAGMPGEVLAALANDMGRYIEARKDSDDAENHLAATNRMALLRVLTQSIDQAQTAGLDLSDRAGAVARLQEFAKGEIGKAISKQLTEMRQPDLDVYLLDVFAGKTRKKQLALVYERKSFLGVSIPYLAVREVEAVWTAQDVELDMAGAQKVGKFLGWENEDYARRIGDYFHDDPALALQVMKVIGQIYDPTNGRPRHIEYEFEGTRRSLTIAPSRGVDIALNSGRLVVNTGHMAFIGILKNSEPIKKVWDYWGDVNNVKDLAKSLSNAWGTGITDPTKHAEIAKAEFAALGQVLGMNELPERLLAGEWKDRAEALIGGKTILSKTANTSQAIIRLATEMRFTRDEALDLAFAGVKDMVLAAQPELAVALALHGMYSGVKSFVVSSFASADLVNLIAQNGDWNFPEDGSTPTLKGIYVYGRYIAESAEGRAKLCTERATSPARSAPRPPVGIEAILRIGTQQEQEEGTQLCKRYSKGTCEEPGSRVFPRKQMLVLFKDGAFHDSDILMRANVDAVKGIADWTILQWAWDGLTGVDPEKWTAEWLSTHGIFVKTPEDSPDFIKDKVFVNPNMEGSWFQRSFNAGAQQTIGYLVSQYWVRRQFIMECQLLDPLIKEAARKADKGKIEEKAGPDYWAQLKKIDDRIMRLDDKVWPQIAVSSQPYDVFKPPSQKRRILQDFRYATIPARLYLLARMRAEEAPKVEDETKPKPSEPMPDDVKRAVAQALLDVARMADLFEDAYDNALAAMGESDSKAGEGDGFTLKPFDVEFFPVDSYQENMTNDDPFSGLSVVDTPPAQIFYAGQSMSWDGLDRVKTASEKWVKDYRSAIKRADDDMAKVMAAFKQRLTPLTAIDQLFNNPLSGLLELSANDLGLRHPLWRSQLRLALQDKRLERAIANEARVLAAEWKLLSATLKFYDEVATPPVTLAEARSRGEKRYRKQLELAARMFDIKLDRTPADKPTLTEELKLTAATSVIKDSGFTAEQIKGWTKKHIWEIVQDEASPEWFAIPPDRPNPDALTCAYMTGEDAFPDKVFAKNSKDKAEQVYAPLESGKYKLRMTILADGDVPMSQETMDVTIEPARISGELEANGAQLQQAQLGIYMNERAADAASRPRFYAAGPAKFEAYLCEFHAVELTRTVKDEMQLKQPAEISSFFDVQARALIPGYPEFPSERVEARLKSGEKGHFELLKPLVINMDQQASIDVAVNDVTATAIKDAEITVTARAVQVGPDGGGERKLRGPPPIVTKLSLGEQVTAAAKLTTADGVVEAETDAPYFHKFDPAKRVGDVAVSLKIAMPLYETGRLAVSGRFTAGSDGVGGGIMRAPVITGDDATIQVTGGGGFEIVNSGKRALIDKGIAFEALLHDASPEKWLLRAGDGTYQAPLPMRQDGKVDLGEIAVGRVQLKPVKVVASVVDASGVAVPNNEVEVTLEDKPLAALDREKFSGEWALSKWDEEVTLEARYRMPDNSWVEAKHKLTVADIGDRFRPRDPKPVEIQLPVFLPKNLAFIWQGRIAGETGSVPGNADFLIKVSDPKQEEGVFDSLGRELNYPLILAVRVGGTLELIAEAGDQRKRYRGTLTATAPDFGAKEARLGEVVLTATEGVVPNVAGMTEAQARALLEEHGLVLAPVTGEAAKDEAKAGLAYAQEPQAGTAGKPTLLAIGKAVTVTFFAVPKQVSVPAVRGLPVDDAAAILAGAGFQVEKKPLGPAAEGQEPDVVVAQVPKPGDPGITPGQTVVITYYEPPPPPIIKGPGDDGTKVDPWAGPWKGTFKLTGVDVAIPGVNLRCDNAATCPATLRNTLQTMPINQEAMFVGMDANVFALVAGAVDLLMEGIDISFELYYDPAAKGYRGKAPGMPPDQAAASKDQVPALIENPPGVLKGTVTYPGEATSKIDIELKLSSDGGQIDMYVRAETTAKDGRLFAEARSTYTHGTIDFNKVQNELSGRFQTKVQPYIDIVTARLGQQQ